MIAALRELLNAHQVTLYLLIVLYFWGNWTLKLVLSLFYRPLREGYAQAVTVIMPVYNEDRSILEEALQRILAQPAGVVEELIIITDHREPDLNGWLETHLPADPRVRIVTGHTSGKRFSLRLGIELAHADIVVSIESDVLIRPDSISELIKPFQDPRVGGVIGDQEVHKPHRNNLTFLDFICEKVKYTLSYPALSVARQVTVLSGRAVAYRRAAVLPLLDGLTHEIFLGKRCVSGDDGRMTSLLLEQGWQTLFQSTSVIETVSPDTLQGLLKQRTRWYRNTCRRTLRALFWDGLWVWRYPLATWHMLTAWLNTVMASLAIYLLVSSLWQGSFFWFGTEVQDITIRLVLLFFGLVLTRFIRAARALRHVRSHRPEWRWLLFFVLPFYLILLWMVRLRAMLTLNKQGWITRTVQAAGGVNGNWKP